MNLMVDASKKESLLASCEGRTIACSDRNACDVELLSVGGFSPLTGFMNEVCSQIDAARASSFLKVCQVPQHQSR